MLKHTPDENPDKTQIPKVIALVKEFLSAVNTETGKAENRFNLLQLDQQLVFRQGEEVVSVDPVTKSPFAFTRRNRTFGYRRKGANSSTKGR